MKTVEFNNYRDLVEALLSGRKFCTDGYHIEFTNREGFVGFRLGGEREAVATNLFYWLNKSLGEKPNPRHHAEIIKIWASDENIVIEFQHASKDWYETESPPFHSTVTYRARAGVFGEVIIVSEAKQ